MRPRYVLAGLIGIEWLATLGLALSVRHNGWLYYQGGDQVWYYTTSWFLGHGKLPATVVGYGWSILLLPFVPFAGADLLAALPAIVLLNTLVLMPVAIVALYGLAERLAGRLFGYWAALLWVVVPFIGIKYADAGYHSRFTEQTLPQGLGLTAMADFPSMVMLIVSAYFVVRTVQRPSWVDGTLAGLFGGFAIGIKPSSSLFLVGVALALLGCRHWRAASLYLMGLAPPLVALLVWKWRAYGYVPLFHAAPVGRTAIGATGPLAALNLHRYTHFLNWAQFGDNLAQLREHFWSARVIEWLILAGVVALARRSRLALLLVGGWLMTFILVKGSYTYGKIEDGSLFRLLLPAAPAFVLLLASLPFLLPGVPRRVRPPDPPRPWGGRSRQLTLVGAAALLFALVPTALAASSTRVEADVPPTVVLAVGPVPPTLKVHATLHGDRVHLSWPALRPGTARVFYQVLRTNPTCLRISPTSLCFKNIVQLRRPGWDETLTPGFWAFRVTLASSWDDNAAGGDPYLISPLVPVTVR